LQDVAGLLEKQGIKFPQLVDCLSCQKGCNGGPGTKNGRMAIDELESPVRQRNADLEERSTAKQMEKVYRKYSNTLNKFWKPGLYERKYRDLSGNFDVTPPDGEQLKDIYESLNKFTENDLLDCTACGYETCKSMAAAIFYGLNKPENCTSYNISRLEKEKKTQAGIPDESKEQIKRALCIVDEINKAVNVLNDRVNSQVKAVDGSSAITGKIFESLKSTTDLSRQKQDAMKELIDNAAKGRESMHETILSVEEISRSVDGIASAIKIISGIAANTKLLAMNAAIEAAHAGDAGRGFAVVADEIRRLSETTGENSRNISKTLSNIIDGISVTSKRSTETNSMIESMSREIGDFTGTMAELAGILTELSSGSGEITAGLNTLGELASSIKTSCTEMLSMTGELKDGMENLSAGRQ
ncbi:MAG: methyl-accepting chemotaxis protein, partial [Treponema sp.]|nr:methyl-accepting chemotaxis protein [Treponema sp.]